MVKSINNNFQYQNLLRDKHNAFGQRVAPPMTPLRGVAALGWAFRASFPNGIDGWAGHLKDCLAHK